MNLIIPMNVKEDSTEEKNIYFLAKYRSPISVDLTKGVAFLLFVSQNGKEQLQVAPLDPDNHNLSRFTQKDNRVKLRIYRREDVNGKTYYVGKLKMNAKVSFSDGGSFMAWISKQNSEELQIVGEFEEV